MEKLISQCCLIVKYQIDKIDLIRAMLGEDVLLEFSERGVHK